MRSNVQLFEIEVGIKLFCSAERLVVIWVGGRDGRPEHLRWEIRPARGGEALRGAKNRPSRRGAGARKWDSEDKKSLVKNALSVSKKTVRLHKSGSSNYQW